MKQRFYVFVQCDAGRTYEVGMTIATVKKQHVAEVSSISGKWDLLLRIEIDNRKDVGKEIVEILTGIDGIKRTKTIVAYPIFDPADIFFDEEGDP
jgi:DNA-binding Lrp family transcriptional regulator